MPSFSDVLLSLRSIPAGRNRLLSMDAEIEAWRLCREDPYQENARMWDALRCIGITDGEALHKWYQHSFTCAIREAAYLEDNPLYQAPNIEIHGQAWLDETNGHPTLLVSAMTQALPDALAAIQHLAQSRKVVIYGESMSVEAFGALAENAAGSGLSAVRHIHNTLRNNGVLCTYPDFVYRGHPSIEVTLFGRQHAMSSGFASLAGRHGAMLLPTMLRSEDDGNRLCIEFDEPTLIPRLTEAELSIERAHLAQSLADILASLIERNTAQWLLLPTLTFDSPQISLAKAKQQPG